MSQQAILVLNIITLQNVTFKTILLKPMCIPFLVLVWGNMGLPSSNSEMPTFLHFSMILPFARFNTYDQLSIPDTVKVLVA